ncbi:MAG TPA: hypothetical protein VF273_09470 [Pelobium sp.]
MDLQATKDFLFKQPVGQLAKTGLPTLKLLKNGAFSVGRHIENSPHVSERAQACDLNEKFDLKAMTYLNSLFGSLFSKTKVVFHNPLYLEQIQAGFLPEESDIFLGFVKTFAKFRYAQFTNEITTIITNDNDFYLAFKLMRERKLSDYSDIKPKNKNKILDLIKVKFKNRTFTPKIIAQELFYNYAFIHRILALLILEREIEFVKEISGQKSFRLREKPVLNVTYR